MDHLRDDAICLRTTAVVLFQGWRVPSICASFASFALRFPPNLFSDCQFMLLEASGVFVISAIFDQLMSIFVHVAVPQIDQVSIFADGITVLFGNEIDQHPKQSGLSSSSTKFN